MQFRDGLRRAFAHQQPGANGRELRFARGGQGRAQCTNVDDGTEHARKLPDASFLGEDLPLVSEDPLLVGQDSVELGLVALDPALVGEDLLLVGNHGIHRHSDSLA